jgi:hypothetical protein
MTSELVGRTPSCFRAESKVIDESGFPLSLLTRPRVCYKRFPEGEGMRWRFSLSAVCLVVVSLLGAGSQAASAQPRLDVFVTPFPNAPFSGVIQVQRTFVDKDGNVSNYKTMRNIGRDTQGRIFNEVRTLEPLSFAGQPDVRGILIYDPQSRTSTHLDPKAHTFTTGTVNRPPETVPPALLYASPTGTNLPQNPYLKEEDLGVHEIDGVSAHGVRETQIIPADTSSGTREIQVTDEFWYSPDLRINLIIRHNDPRTGSVTMTVTQIARTDPDPSRFQIPEDYTPADSVKGTN